MHKTIAIVQARMGSTRLPGKSLALAWRNMSLLELVLRRVQQAKTLDQVVLATSDNPRDDVLVTVAEVCRVPSYRGDELDVLGRFSGAAAIHPTLAVVRICADNPFVDPAEIDKLVEFFWDQQPCDYAYNHLPTCGLPDGAGAEILSAETLHHLAEMPMSPAYREHVTLWLQEHPDEFKIEALTADRPLRHPHYRLDVDYPGDLRFLHALTDRLPAERGPLWSTAEIVRVLDEEPKLHELREKRTAERVNPTHRIIFVDAAIDPEILHDLGGDALHSTNPAATLSLSRAAGEFTRLEDLCTTADSLAVHAQVAAVTQRLRAAYDDTALATRYPNPFQVHSYHVSFLFFSLLSKLSQLDAALKGAQGDGGGEGARVLLIADHPEPQLPSYPLTEDDRVYAWLLSRLATVRNVGLEWRSTPARSTDGGVTWRIRSRIWASKLRSTLRPHARRARAARQWLNVAVRRDGALPVVLGHRDYQARGLSTETLRTWGLAWRETPSSITSGGQGTVSDEDQQLLSTEIRRVLEQVLSEELGDEHALVLRPMVERIAASMRGFIEQCSAVDDYLAKTRPIAYVSSSLAGVLEDRLLAIICRRRGTPVIGLQHGGSYGELADGCSRIGATVYLDELEVCDTFVAWGPGCVTALQGAQETYRPEAHHARVVAGSCLTIPSPKTPSAKDPPMSANSPGIRLLYVPHMIQVNVMRTAWLRDRYVEHMVAMCDLLQRYATTHEVAVKLPLADDRWNRLVADELLRHYGQLRFVWRSHSVPQLADEADLVILDVPETALCQVLPLPVHILTVEHMAEMYPGGNLASLDSLDLLRRRCLVAQTYTDLRHLVERCLAHPRDMAWPDLHNHDYFYRYVKNPADVTGYEAYEAPLRGGLASSRGHEAARA